MKNYDPLEVTANFIIVYKDEESSMEGWISLEKTMLEFISLLKDEVEYQWGTEFAYMEDYMIFYIDLNDKNKLKDIKDEDLEKLLRIDNLDKDGHLVVKRVIENAKNYHRDIDYKKVVDSILQQTEAEAG